MIIVGSLVCPKCADAKKLYPGATFYLASDLLAGKHEHSDDFAAALAYADMSISDVSLPVILDDNWYVKT